MARHQARLLAALALAVPGAGAAQQLRLAQVPVSGRAGLDSLARLGFEVADVRRVAGGLYAVVVVSDQTERLLTARGFRPAAIPGAPTLATADTYKVFRSFDKPVTGIRATLAAWAAADSLIHVDSIGASLQGRPILAVKIGDSTDSPSRPNVLFMATHHAREWVSTEVAMKLIRWLADSLPAATRNARDIWVIPVENPDGYQFTFDSVRLWRKNLRHNADGSVGVDPNRNYPAFWGYDDLGSSGNGASEIYRGAGPASEPETQAIIAFHAAHPPVVSLSYHSYSDLEIYPYGYRSGAIAPDAPVFAALAGTDLDPAVRDSVPGTVIPVYHPGSSWGLYPTNGEYSEWAYRAHGTIAFTTELTSGCCLPDSSYYGFVFPDDSGEVERVFRDNLPFAVALIGAAADPASAVGVTGATPETRRLLSIWPETWLSLPDTAGPPYTFTLRTGSGGIGVRSFSADSLDRGRYDITWRSDLHLDTVRAVRVDGVGLASEVIALAGAEDADAGWTGNWFRTTGALMGKYAWQATDTLDTLTSPLFDLRGRSRLWLQFWTKHAGSTFTPQDRGLVELSTDSGATWTDVAAVVGDGENWYPVRVDLPAAAGHAGVRVRFRAVWFPWFLDAVGLVSDSTTLFQNVAATAGAEVSENPVRSNRVTITWPATSAAAVVGIYGFDGRPLIRATVAAGQTEYDWDLTAGGGKRVANGAYVVVVRVGGTVYRHRIFVTR